MLPTPKQATAGFFGDDGPQNELRELVASAARFDELRSKLTDG